MQSYTYYLFHRPTSKKYYGVRTANKTLPEEDLWVKYFSSSKKVKKLIEKYGKKSFDYEIREKFNCPIKAQKWEDEVLRRLKVGDKDEWLNDRVASVIHFTDEIKRKISKANKNPNQKTRDRMAARRCIYKYKILSPSGTTYDNINNMAKFCREHKLNRGAMNHVAQGRSLSYKGWIAFIKGKEHLRDGIYERIQTVFKYDYVIKSPNNKVFNVKNLTEFSRKNNLDNAALDRTVRGIQFSHKGWTGYIKGKEYLRKNIEKEKIQFLIFSDSNNRKTKINIDKLSEFCKKNNLNKKSVSQVYRGLRYDHRGWICVAMNHEYLRKNVEKDHNIDHKNYRKYVLISPIGRVFKISSLNKFCLNNNLSDPGMNSMLLGRRSSYKGWTGYIVGKAILRKRFNKGK